ncbi:RHS repeat-associated core domain-containing protein [Pseudomonas shirazica]|nr:RHS repeat-associated core domain-containing protein [Pseudomonas shirazica]
MPFAYSPYGFFCGGPEYPLLHFDGEAWDGWSASYPLGKGKRFYRPKLMRFTTPDNLSPFRAGGVNAYAYCKGDPVNFTDPSGMMRTLKSLAQQALKKQGVISKRSKKFCVRLNWMSGRHHLDLVLSLKLSITKGAIRVCRPMK